MPLDLAVGNNIFKKHEELLQFGFFPSDLDSLIPRANSPLQISAVTVRQQQTYRAPAGCPASASSATQIFANETFNQ